jgi:hypothetical protein
MKAREYKEKGVRHAKADRIPPKGLPTTDNGKPYRESKSALPPSNSSPDYGAARASVAGKSRKAGIGAPKRTPDKSKKIAAPKQGQKMREYNTSRGTKAK